MFCRFRLAHILARFLDVAYFWCSSACRYYLDMHVIEMGTRPLVKTAARLFRELCYSNKSQLMAGIICAGWDSAKGGQVRARLVDYGRVVRWTAPRWCHHCNLWFLVENRWFLIR